MKLSRINNQCAFKTLTINYSNKSHMNAFLNQYKDVIEEVSKDKDVVVSAEDAMVSKGSDYIISKPVINVMISPKKIFYGNEMETDKKYDTVMRTVFTYVPSVKNEKEGKFIEVLHQALSLLG